ncbi:MAG TPA: class I SAM-dependent methyltransferase [Thermoplasmata archaeon]|nr:class I SAM-dependent methyltransferase [Thermoplasmata archaeon]
MDDTRPKPPHGLRLRARALAGIQALESHGVRAGLQALLLGREHYDALQQIGKIEPLLLQPLNPDGALPSEQLFSRCSDIFAHLPTLYRLTLDGQRRRVLELGTRDGDSTIALLLASKEIGGRLTSVDIEPCPIATARVHAAGLQDLWTFLQTDDLALDWNQPIDHLFIDTSHRYARTIDELRKFEPFVVPGGAISLHDTTSYPAVWRAVEEVVRGRSDLWVFRYYHNNGLAVIEKRRADPR